MPGSPWISARCVPPRTVARQHSTSCSHSFRLPTMGEGDSAHGGRQFRARAGERFRSQYLFEQLASGRIRIHAEFAAQDLFALVIGAQRAGAVVIAGVQANQHLVVRLGQRIQCHQPFGVTDGGGIVAAGFEQRSPGGCSTCPSWRR